MGTADAGDSDSGHESSRFSGLKLVSLLTLSSRVLGLIRDMLMASRFGNGALLDAFSVAFRVPNLARRMFGEGALSTAFLPALVTELEQRNRASAWRLATAVFVTLFGVLSLIVLAGECLLGWGWLSLPDNHEGRILIGLTAVMLPYLLLICLAAQVSAIFHALGRFGWPAFSPILLNLLWIGLLCFPVVKTWQPHEQMYAVGWTILFAGFVQLLVPLLLLMLSGFRFARDWRVDGEKVRAISRTMLPILVGLSVTQLNTLADSLIAWGMSAEEGAAPAGWQPLEAGTASALYLGQRLYQFPIGVFGVALGTILFPLFTRHVELKRLELLTDDFLAGMKLVISIAVPASVGLILVARPLAETLFQRGQFDAEDSRQTAEMIRAYGAGVWAFCSLLIVNRVYFALRDRERPLKIGLATMAVNLVLNFTLIWWLRGAGLAAATSIASAFQVLVSCWFLKTHLPQLSWQPLTSVIWKSFVATAVMSAMCWLILQTSRDDVPPPVTLSVAIVSAAAGYLLSAKLLGMHEPFELVNLRRKRK